MNIVFFGTPEFGAIVLEKLVQSGLKPVLVVTAPDKPVGRKQILTPPPAKVSAEQYTISVAQPSDGENLKLKIENLLPDMFVVASYGQILSKEILAIPKFGALNVHPSLLPKYRGSSPVQSAILNGEKTTGVSIMLMDEKIDHGLLLSQREFSISNYQFSNGKGKPTYPELHDALAQLGGELLVETILQWIEGRIFAQAQDHSQATFTKRIKKENGKIDWTKSAEYIDRQVRAFQPWPGTYTEIKIQNPNIKFQNKSKISKLLKILKARVLKQQEEPPPGIGKVAGLPGGEAAVQTGNDCLAIEELQLEGGKPMKIKEFLQGHPEFIGTTLG